MRPSPEEKLRVTELTKLIQIQSNKYHVLDKPEIEDSEYDQLFQELISLEKDYKIFY